MCYDTHICSSVKTVFWKGFETLKIGLTKSFTLKCSFSKYSVSVLQEHLSVILLATVTFAVFV